MTVSRKSPCYHCAERSAACHATCPRYAEWRADYAAAIRRERDGSDADAVAIDANFQIRRRTRKRR